MTRLGVWPRRTAGGADQRLQASLASLTAVGAAEARTPADAADADADADADAAGEAADASPMRPARQRLLLAI